LHALRERGVEYVEVRCMDLDPFEPVGIGAPTVHFLDVFLLHCLLSASPPDTPDEIAALARNQHRAAAFGRQPGLRLERGQGEVTLVEWTAQILEECAPIAEAFDRALGTHVHRAALQAANESLKNLDSLPSARVLGAMQAEHDSSFIGFVRQQSLHTQRQLLGLPWSAEDEARFSEMARVSMASQREIEAADTMPFEIYRQEYLNPRRLRA
jgi:glutamate--cysteine ligase